jgi:hypothetical protein
MKSQRMNLALVMTLIAVLVLCAVPVQAKGTRITFSGLENCISLEGGTVAIHAGNTFIRDATMTCIDTADNPMGTGTNIAGFNFNGYANGDNHGWGKNRIETVEGGVWQCNWNGHGTATTFMLHAECRGEGLYEGLLMKLALDNQYAPEGAAMSFEVFHAGD